MSSKALEGKVAIVTGGTKGIGAAAAARLASEGAKVAVSYGSDAASADEIVKKIGADSCMAIKADAGSVKETQALVEQVVQKYGKIDIAVANAGILPMRDLASTTEKDFDNAFAINVKGPYFLAQAVAPHMAEGAHVIFVSSSLCAMSTVAPGYLLYNSTKGAIEQMTRLIAKDLGTKGIIVNAVAPGPTGTELFFRGKSEQLLTMLKGMSPFKKLGEPEEIAETISFLASTHWVSGQVLRANGAAA